ncbi:MAG TPA: hemerythrin domain-containing protein, partial [Gammaproteobacteria bacterium]|nr:hemerythrin domain-containing protein [Gammaproteobacteria bacterium]
EALADDYRQGRLAAGQLAIVATPRLEGLLADLHGHHQIEDFHYFPVFRRLAPEIGPGIDVLERDHADLTRAGLAARVALRELRAASAGGDTPTSALAADLGLAAMSRLCAGILEHLRDEEDLIVPLLLEHDPAGAQPHGEP